jgi:hypothetical protein
MTGISDEGLVEEVSENLYMQAFCGFTECVTDEALDPSTLSKLREKLRHEFFKQLERKTYKVLIDRKIIRAKGMLVDAKVFPEGIRYPNDVGLLNTVREWLVRTVKRMGKVIGKKPRPWQKALWFRSSAIFCQRWLRDLDESLDSGNESSDGGKKSLKDKG